MKGWLIFRVVANTHVHLFRHGETWQKTDRNFVMKRRWTQTNVSFGVLKCQEKAAAQKTRFTVDFKLRFHSDKQKAAKSKSNISHLCREEESCFLFESQHQKFEHSRHHQSFAWNITDYQQSRGMKMTNLGPVNDIIEVFIFRPVKDWVAWYLGDKFSCLLQPRKISFPTWSFLSLLEFQ